MDTLDFSIYRFLSPNGEARFWAGRRVIDPTIPVRAIAEAVGISENGVRARLRGLTERGYLRGRAVTPNPSLFGARVFVAELAVKEAEEAESMFRDLALVDGAIFARDTLDEGERHVAAYFVSDSDAVAARRTALLRRLSSAGQFRPPRLYAVPACTQELSPLDWRLLEALCRLPDASMAEVARAARISLKTAARRTHQLVGSKACWWTHGPESEEFPLALVRMDLRDPSVRDAVVGATLREAEAWMPVASDGLGLEPSVTATVVAGLVPADAPTVLERLVKKLIAVAGVESVHRTFALGSKTYPTWFTDRIRGHVAARS